MARGEGKLCYNRDSGALVYKHGGDDLVYKTAPAVIPGNIDIIVMASQSEIGPIASCGNAHSVMVYLDNISSVGSVSVSVAPQSGRYTGSTQTGCAYPDENPSVSLSVVAVQQSTGAVANTSVTIPNVAEGAFSISITVNATGLLTGVSGQAGGAS